MKLLAVLLFVGYCSAGHLGYSYVSPAVSHAYYTPSVVVGHQPLAATVGYKYAAPTVVKTQVKAIEVKQAPIPILKYIFDRQADSFNYGYETGNGISTSAVGTIKNAGAENAHPNVQGSYSFTGDDGKVYTVTYEADENGFRAQGDHLPTPPPIPEDIQRSIELNAAEEAALAASGHKPEWA